MMEEDRKPFPLGQPIGRKAEWDGLTPIEGRKFWFTDRKGREVYVDPHAPPKTGDDAIEKIPV